MRSEVDVLILCLADVQPARVAVPEVHLAVLVLELLAFEEGGWEGYLEGVVAGFEEGFDLGAVLYEHVVRSEA